MPGKEAVEMGGIIHADAFPYSFTGHGCGIQQGTGIFDALQAYVFQRCGSYISAENACEIGVAHMQVFRKAADPQILRKMLFDIAQGIRNQLGMTAYRRKACRFQQIHKKSVVHFG